MGNQDWRQLDIAICGAGISGLATAIALRRAGTTQIELLCEEDLIEQVLLSLSCGRP